MNNKNPSVIQVMSRAVADRLKITSEKPFDEIEKLPDHISEELTLSGIKLIVTVWHDTLDTGEHRLVVQAYKPRILGIGRMHTDGFITNSQGSMRELTSEERAPFT